MFRLLKNGFFYLWLTVAAAYGQDCRINFTFTSTNTTAPFNNQATLCTNWTIAYFSTGFSGVSIQVESAPIGSVGNTPGTFVLWAGTVVNGTHPATSTAQAQVYLNGSYPFVRVNLTTATGSGSITGALLGYRVQPANFPVAGASPILCPTDLCVPPANIGFTWLNQHSAVLDNAIPGTEHIHVPAPNTSGDTLNNAYARLYPGGYPATPWCAVLGFIPSNSVGGGNFTYGVGIFIYDGTTKAVSYEITQDASFAAPMYSTWSNFATPTVTFDVADIGAVWESFNGATIWLRVKDDGTNFTAAYSAGDGYSAHMSYTPTGLRPNLTKGRTAFLTPASIGYYIHEGNGNYEADVVVISFSVSSC